MKTGKVGVFKFWVLLFATAFGSYGEKSLYGRKHMGIIRSTFVIGEDGKILKAYPKVKAESHSEELLGDLKSL